MEDKYIEMLVEAIQSVKSAHKRLDVIENKVEDIHELAYSIKEIAKEVKLMREDVNKIDVRVESLEKEPVQEYKETKSKIKWQIIGFVLGAILTALAGLILK